MINCMSVGETFRTRMLYILTALSPVCRLRMNALLKIPHLPGPDGSKLKFTYSFGLGFLL